MVAFKDNNAFGVADKHQLENNPVTESSKVGKLLYEVENKRTKCDGNIDWCSLQFYDHVLIVHSKHRWCCCPQKYYAEAIPRFKILNVTFTNGRRRQWRWVLLLLILGIFLMVIGILVLPPKCTPSSCVYCYDEPKGAAVALIIFGVVMIVTSPAPLFFARKFRFVTIDVKGIGSNRWFSSAKAYTFGFLKPK
jgi:hypothetical protein